MINLKFILLSAMCFSLFSCSSPSNKNVAWRGEIKNVSEKGNLEDNALLTELTNGKHLYAVGPVSQLDGEITVIDGVCYIAQVVNESSLKVTEDCTKKAPFLVYSYYTHWREIPINRPFKTLKDLSRSLTELLIENGYITEDPTGLMIDAEVERLDYHVAIKDPSGRKSYQQSLEKFSIKNDKIVMIGFYSKNHGGVFTDKGQNLHLHFLSSNKQSSGHVDDFFIPAGSKIKLYFPLKR